MSHDPLIAFADQIGQFFANNSSIPPVAGRLLGYLIICEPGQQSINDLAKALQASRSAVVGAVQVLEHRAVVKRARQAGSRNYLISFDIAGYERRGFDGTAYTRLSDLFKEGLGLLQDVSAERKAFLQELIAFSDFLAERMPALQETYRRQQLGRQRGFAADSRIHPEST